MKISVVTVALNSARTIPYTIESFLAQTHEDAELVIIDGASRDGTAEIARGYDDPRLVVCSERDAGLYDAMNKGLRRYSGDAVGFLNSDDSYHDRFALERIAEGLRGHDIVHGNLNFVKDHVSKAVTRRWRGTAYRPGSFRRGWMPAHPTLYMRRAVAARTGEFNTDLRIAADYDYMLRAMEMTPVSVRFVDDVLIDMMAGGNSTRGWAAYARANLESLRSRQRWLGSGIVDLALLSKPVRKIPQIRI